MRHCHIYCHVLAILEGSEQDVCGPEVWGALGVLAVTVAVDGNGWQWMVVTFSHPIVITKRNSDKIF